MAGKEETTEMVSASVKKKMKIEEVDPRESPVPPEPSSSVMSKAAGETTNGSANKKKKTEKNDTTESLVQEQKVNENEKNTSSKHSEVLKEEAEKVSTAAALDSEGNKVLPLTMPLVFGETITIHTTKDGVEKKARVIGTQQRKKRQYLLLCTCDTAPCTCERWTPHLLPGDGKCTPIGAVCEGKLSKKRDARKKTLVGLRNFIDGERFGTKRKAQICAVNTIVQALFACVPFRQEVSVDFE